MTQSTSRGADAHLGGRAWGADVPAAMNVQKMTHCERGKSAFGAGLLPRRTGPSGLRARPPEQEAQHVLRHWRSCRGHIGRRLLGPALSTWAREEHPLLYRVASRGRAVDD